MWIISKRTMSLAGQHVQAGIPAEVAKPDGEFAIRMGWAIETNAPQHEKTAKPKK